MQVRDVPTIPKESCDGYAVYTAGSGGLFMTCGLPQGGMTNDETRMTKQARMPNDEGV
jgi:hypothetical protein